MLHTRSKVASNQRYLCAVQEEVFDTLAIQMDCDTTMMMAEIPLVEIPVVEIPAVSLFENHLLPVKNDFSLLSRTELGSEFAFLILAFCALLIIYLQRNSDGIFSNVFKAAFDVNQANQDARIENSQRTRNMVLVQILALISISLFISGAFPLLFETNMSIAQLFFGSLGVIAGVMVVKRTTLWMFSVLFDVQTEARTHRFHLGVLYSVSGLALLPLALLIFYSPQIPSTIVAYIGIAIALLFYLKGLLRGFLVAATSPAISTLHLFYYFCALEVLPAFVLVRLAYGL